MPRARKRSMMSVMERSVLGSICERARFAPLRICAANLLAYFLYSPAYFANCGLVSQSSA